MMIKLFAMPQKTWWLRLNSNISVSSILLRAQGLLLIKNFMKRIHKMKIDARLLFAILKMARFGNTASNYVVIFTLKSLQRN